jgi:phosphotransferase system HPr-like phosphotransfer protein
MLAASKGTEMILTTEGKGENTASTKLQELIQNRFGEEE